MHLKLLQKERFKKQQKQLVIYLEIKTLIKLQVSKNSPQINSKTNEEETIKEIFTPPELRHEIINKLRLKEENY